jgi:hypothetical protein
LTKHTGLLFLLHSNTALLPGNSAITTVGYLPFLTAKTGRCLSMRITKKAGLLQSLKGLKN